MSGFDYKEFNKKFKLRNFYWIPLNENIEKTNDVDKEIEEKIFWESFDWKKIKEKISVRKWYLVDILREILEEDKTLKEIAKKYNLNYTQLCNNLRQLKKVISKVYLGEI